MTEAMAPTPPREAPKPISKSMSYGDILGITRKKEKDNTANKSFTVRVARYWDLQRALRSEMEVGGITQDDATHRTAILLTGMDAKMKKTFESGEPPGEITLYQRSIELAGGIVQEHKTDLSFFSRVVDNLRMLKTIQAEVTARRITQDDADHQIALLFPE
jgi:hypothetical protein